MMTARFHFPLDRETVPLLVTEKLVFTGPPQRSDSEPVGPPAALDASPAARNGRQPELSPGWSPRRSLLYTYFVNTPDRAVVRFQRCSATGLCPKSKVRVRLRPPATPVTMWEYRLS